MRQASQLFFAFVFFSRICFRFLEVRFAEHSSRLKDLSPGSLLSGSEAFVCEEMPDHTYGPLDMRLLPIDSRIFS
jgi:hypothetical protein